MSGDVMMAKTTEQRSEDAGARVAELERALEVARHELVTLHGLIATDLRSVAAIMPPDVVQHIDTAAVVAQLDAALGHTEHD